jgi:PKD repeat protein
MQAAWLDTAHDLASINGHFSHWEAVPADEGGGVLTAADVLGATADRSGALDFSVGCHSGLSIPDDQVNSNPLDITQAQAAQGVNWMGNTGFGYGDYDEIAYSEELTLMFVDYLSQGMAVGDALRKAKAQYLNRTGVHGFTPYDEKVLSEMTLYGLPMLQVSFPAGFEMPGPAWLAMGMDAEEQIAQQQVGNTGSLTTQQVNFTLPVAMATTVNGSYFHVNGEIETVAGMPILPRTSVDVTLPGEIARGAFFEGGTYQTYEGFDPVVSRLITETTSGLSEPQYTFEVWAPSVWDMVNSLDTPEGLQQRLVVLAAQYQASTPYTGTLHVFDTMDYTVYYSDSLDVLAPTIWDVSDEVEAGSREIMAEITDHSGILRAAVAYTVGDGEWHVAEMAESAEDIYTTSIPDKPDLIYLVEALDRAGNVSVADFKAYYSGPGSNVPVEAEFEAAPLSGIAPLTVTFSNVSYGSYNTCLWEYGDGESSAQCADPIHEYAEPGSYTVTLTINGSGGTDTLMRPAYITITEPVDHGSKIYLPIIMRP